MRSNLIESTLIVIIIDGFYREMKPCEIRVG